MANRLAEAARRSRAARQASKRAAGPAHVPVWAWIAPVVAVAFVVVVVVELHAGGGRKETQLKARFPPVEFLYLDKPRALSYLEEIQGGAVNSEEESRSATNNLEAKIKLEESVEAGSSRQEVAQLQRSITPTVASIFMELRAALERGGKTATIEHPAEYKEINGLEEGQFVTFKTEELHRPLYLDPYLAVHQDPDPTLSALFPEPAHDRRRRLEVRAEREASRQFVKQVGASPHMVFSLRPGAKATGVHYLLPLNIGSFNREDSVLKNGGGSLTVLGKLTRVLPEPSEEEARGQRPSYIDFATREAWRLPIHYAPDLLVCRSDPDCRRLQGSVGRGSHVAVRARRARRAMESALVRQTEVANKGAVIVPVAIYK